MSLTLLDSTAVIVARNFNPTIVNPLWLVENQLLQRNELEAGSFYTDMFAGRLRLDATPAIEEKGGQEVEYLLLAFNFNRSVSGRAAVADIREMSGRWGEARAYALHLVEAIAKRDTL